MNTIEIGSAAEDRAVRLLVERGYEIVERNYRHKSGELDVIARQGDCLVFVEVRSRGDTDHGDAVETVDRRKQYRVARVAEHYLIERDPTYEEARFDVIAINGDAIDLYVDAFRLGGLR
jgi:putative endonuclease